MQVLYSSQIDNSLLFDPSLISQKLQQQLPSGYILRPLHIEDFEKGIIRLINRNLLILHRIPINSRAIEHSGGPNQTKV